MAEKVTKMVLKVEHLQCTHCCKKIKKLLCKFPQIRDHVFDEKQNTVTITVICCSPEKIRQKLCCKGGKTIKSIEIVKPKEEPVKHKINPNPQPPQPVTGYPYAPFYPMIPIGVCCVLCYDGLAGGPCYHGYGRLPSCCDDCGRQQPCYCGYGGTKSPPPCCDDCGRPPPCDCGCGCGGTRGRPPPCDCGCGGTRGYASRCDYICEKNSTSCSVM